LDVIVLAGDFSTLAAKVVITWACHNT
jgi:hypothetical protein